MKHRAPQLEVDVEVRACARAKDELGVINFKINTLSGSGWPDRQFLIPGGRPLLIEFKRVNKEARRLQEHRHKQLRDLGYWVEVHTTVEGALAAIRTKLEEAKHGQG